MFINEYKPEFQEMKNLGNVYILAGGGGVGVVMNRTLKHFYCTLFIQRIGNYFGRLSN